MLKIFKKILGLMFLLAVLSCNSANAATFTAPVAEDFYIHKNDTIVGNNTLRVDTILGNDYINRSYLVFDLSSISAQETITGATLSLFNEDHFGIINPIDFTINIYQVDPSFFDKKIKFNKPGFDSSDLIGAFKGHTLGSQWVSASLSISDWNNVINDGILAVALQNESDSCLSFTGFSSSEGSIVSNRPNLEITSATAPVPEPPSVIMTLMVLTGLFLKICTKRRKFV